MSANVGPFSVVSAQIFASDIHVVAFLDLQNQVAEMSNVGKFGRCIANIV